MQTQKTKLQDIAKITTGLPVQRYIGKEDAKKQKIILTMPELETDEEFQTAEENISETIKDRFYSKKRN